MKNPERQNLENDAERYLKYIEDGYVYDSACRLHKPKAHTTDGRSAKNEADNRKSPLYVDVRRDWLVIGVSVLTFILLAATVIYARRQWLEANRSANAANESAYMACLSAQATQVTFRQLQQSASDSHASAVATIEQTRASVIAERAIMSFSAKFPTPESVIGNQLSIPYIITNMGKSEALGFHLRVKAVLLANNDVLVMDNTNLETVDGKYIPAGYEYPEKAGSDPRYRAVSASVAVRNRKGERVPASDPIAQSFTSGGPVMVAVYGTMKYSDFAGSHQTRFCNPVFSMSPGTTRKRSENQGICQKYNYENDEYNAMPKLDTLLPANAGEIKPITCIKPHK